MMKFSYLLASPSGRGGTVEDCDGEGRHTPLFAESPNSGIASFLTPKAPSRITRFVHRGSCHRSD